MSINLHSIVRGAITSIHEDIDATLYQSVSQEVTVSGSVRSSYKEGVKVKVQVQSEGGQSLYHADRVGMEEVTRKFYLFSDHALDKKVAGIVRPLSRTGDFLLLKDGTWWLIESILEDFTLAGWVCVRGTMQIKPPVFIEPKELSND